MAACSDLKVHLQQSAQKQQCAQKSALQNRYAEVGGGLGGGGGGGYTLSMGVIQSAAVLCVRSRAPLMTVTSS